MLGLISISRIHNYVKNGLDNNIVDPTRNKVYEEGKALRQETNSTTIRPIPINSSRCVKGKYIQYSK